MHKKKVQEWRKHMTELDKEKRRRKKEAKERDAK